MKKTIRNLTLVSLLLLLSAAGSWFLSERQRVHEQRERSKEVVQVFDLEPDTTNAWQNVGYVFFILSISVAFAACLMWLHNQSDSE